MNQRREQVWTIGSVHQLIAFPISIFHFYLRLRGFGGSACFHGADEAGVAVFPGTSLTGNFAASFTMAAARCLLILHAGS